jgi:Short C-terminal domain
MPYALPRSRELQNAYNEQLRHAYSSTRRVAPSGRDPLDEVRELAELYRSGVLTDDEFTAAKAKALGLDGDAQ